MKYLFFILFFSSLILFSSNEDERIKRVENHIFLEDYFSAFKEAKIGIKEDKQSLLYKKYYLKALALHGDEKKAISKLINVEKKFDSLMQDLDLIDTLSWAVLKKGVQADQYSTKLSSMIGVFYTKDYKAVNIIKNLLDDSNSIIRSVAIQLATSYQDQPLKDKIISLFETEKIWFVRLEIIKAIGQLKIKEKAPCLIEILKNKNVSTEEKKVVTEALINIFDHIDDKKLLYLLENKNIDLKILGINLAERFKKTNMKEKLFDLCFHFNSDVTISAIKAVAFYYKDFLDDNKIEQIIAHNLKNRDNFVQIIAGWFGSIYQNKEAEKILYDFSFDINDENRKLASSAIAHAIKYNEDIAREIFEKSSDDIVKANIAIGFLNEKKNIVDNCSFLFSFMKNKTKLWMWDNFFGLFESLSISKIKHTDQIPNYPEAMDQFVELNILSHLLACNYEKAIDAVKYFLSKKNWGISGLAAVLLLQEGDDNCILVLKDLLNDKEEKIQIQAALALAFIGKENSAISVLMKAYEKAFFDLKINILNALGNFTNERSRKFLIHKLNDPFSQIKISAASSLIQSINL